MPERSLRIIFSATSATAASWPTFEASKPASDNPPALFLLRSLWQVAQYLLDERGLPAFARRLIRELRRGRLVTSATAGLDRRWSRRSARLLRARGGGRICCSAAPDRPSPKTTAERTTNESLFILRLCPSRWPSKHGRFAALTTRIINDLAGFSVSICHRSVEHLFDEWEVALSSDFRPETHDRGRVTLPHLQGGRMDRPKSISRRRILAAGTAGIVGAALPAAGQNPEQAARPKVPADPTKVQGPLATDVGSRSPFERPEARVARRASHVEPDAAPGSRRHHHAGRSAFRAASRRRADDRSEAGTRS